MSGDIPDGVVVRREEPLAPHMPWRTGGPADAYVLVHRRDGLPDALGYCRGQGWKISILGAGTRTVARDGRIAGAVVKLGTGFCGISENDGRLRVGAATPLAMLASRDPAFARLALAPGSVGASLVLDPGWAPYVSRVWCVHRGGEREDDHETFAGRGTTAVVVAVELRTGVEGPAPGPEDPGSWYQPLDQGDLRAIIRKAGLADTRLRAVMVPDEVPEMIVNLGGATSADLALLQRSILERVHKLRGVQLADRMVWLGRNA